MTRCSYRRRMKNFALLVVSHLVVAGAALGAEAQAVRYDDPSGPVTLVISQDIGVRDHPSIAARELSFELAVTRVGAEPAITVDILEARGTYTAHGMEQRLGTRHLRGRRFPMAIDDGGRSLLAGEPDDSPTLDLGPPVAAPLSLATTLADIVPGLPSEPVEVGATWTRRRPIRALEGWGWGEGPLISKHRVRSVERRGARTVVVVETEGEAELTPLGGGSGYRGTLRRTGTWSFDATAGRLLSLSMSQESDGTSPLPQGDVEVHQITHFELETPS